MSRRILGQLKTKFKRDLSSDLSPIADNLRKWFRKRESNDYFDYLENWYKLADDKPQAGNQDCVVPMTKGLLTMIMTQELSNSLFTHTPGRALQCNNGAALFEMWGRGT